METLKLRLDNKLTQTFEQDFLIKFAFKCICMKDDNLNREVKTKLEIIVNMLDLTLEFPLDIHLNKTLELCSR